MRTLLLSGGVIFRQTANVFAAYFRLGCTDFRLKQPFGSTRSGRTYPAALQLDYITGIYTPVDLRLKLSKMKIYFRALRGALKTIKNILANILYEECIYDRS